MTEQSVTRKTTGYRIKPTPLVGVIVVVLYIVLVFGMQLASGIPYAEWTSTPSNTLRAAVIPLAAGSALLIAFLAIARWDMIWRDPGRLPISGVMKVAMIFFVAAVLVRFIGVRWSAVSLALLGVVILSGVLVGFAEETLFRGIFLRSLRTAGRTEAKAALWTAVGFGLFHLPNLLVGVGLLQLPQVVLAGLTGSILYVFRRYRGMIVTAMVAHGTWDISAFLSGSNGAPWLAFVSLALTLVGVVLGILVLVSIWRKDKATVVSPTGIDGATP
jgi:uncharacterized protein